MADDEQDQDPIDQLVDLFVYAPIGLLYEYDEVMERLVKRGKSQVQLARVVGQLAMSGRRAAGDANDVADVASTVVTKVVTELGTLFGMSAEQSTPEAPSTDPRQPTAGEADEPPTVVATPELAEPAESAPSMPIANYDDLKAKEIIPLLGSLSEEQRAVVRVHETGNRARKTVLAKLDRLDD